MNAEKIVSSLLEDGGPDELDAKDFALQFEDPERVAEFREYIKARRRGQRAAKAAYPSDGRIIPCAGCGNPHRRPHGHGEDKHSMCPVCQKSSHRFMADLMGWKWPRQKNPFVKKVTDPPPPKAMLTLGFGDASFPIAGGGQG